MNYIYLMNKYYFVNILRPFVVDILHPNQQDRPQVKQQYDIHDHLDVRYLPSVVKLILPEIPQIESVHLHLIIHVANLLNNN